MSRLQVNFTNAGSQVPQSLEAPDMVTALVVAEINMGEAPAEIRDGDRLLARLEKRGRTHAPFWYVG
ncbi:hypothetical protein [Aurantiacibacter gilvus]|uniref:Uncharacterized protein n=1 Tax=Aurantiacibacter gilvus TaxID=3139141 RepID=A0ABU9IB03_9SPHN